MNSNLIKSALEAYSAAVDFFRSCENLKNRTEFDEVAVMVEEHQVFGEIMKAIHGGGATFFNASDDVVETMPFWGRYGVSYYFLQPGSEYAELVVGKLPRIEMMHVNDGISHAHIAKMLAQKQPGEGWPVHVSYKPKQPGVAAYNEELRRLAEELGFLPVQHCYSTYGMFSYWTHPSYRGLYFKPRVNTRDETFADPATDAPADHVQMSDGFDPARHS